MKSGTCQIVDGLTNFFAWFRYHRTRSNWSTKLDLPLWVRKQESWSKDVNWRKLCNTHKVLLQSRQFDRKLLHSALLPLWCLNIPTTFDMIPAWPLPEIRTIKSTKNPFKHCYVDCFCQLLAEDTCAKTSSKSCWDEYLRLGSSQFIQMTIIL